MPATPPPRRRTPASLACLALAASALVTAGCGHTDADPALIGKDLGRAYSAYAQYVVQPARSGALTPTTPQSSPTSERAAKAARYAVRTLEAAHDNAAPDTAYASFAQKISAANASLNAIAKQLATGRPSKQLVDGGLASLESLRAAARDRGITVPSETVSTSDLDDPPSA